MLYTFIYIFRKRAKTRLHGILHLLEGTLELVVPVIYPDTSSEIWGTCRTSHYHALRFKRVGGHGLALLLGSILALELVCLQYVVFTSASDKMWLEHESASLGPVQRHNLIFVFVSFLSRSGTRCHSGGVKRLITHPKTCRLLCMYCFWRLWLCIERVICKWKSGMVCQAGLMQNFSMEPPAGQDDTFRQWYHFDAEKKTLGHLAKARDGNAWLVLAVLVCLLIWFRRPLRWYFRAKRVLSMIQSGTRGQWCAMRTCI